jgi:capsular polysaccharide transport system permease protein
MRLARRLKRVAGLAGPLPQTADRKLAAASEATLPVPTGGARAPVRFVPLLPISRRPVPPFARPSLRALSFIVVVLLPTALAAAYYFAVAADQYVAEFRFTLNAVDAPRLGPLSLLAGNVTQSPATLESQVLVQYIASRAIIDRIDRSMDIRRLFAPPAADWWSRLARPASIEEVVRYWKGQVDPFYDPAEGTVTVRVRAFSPTDALRLSQAIVAACESLVNDLSLRARRDALRHAQTDVAAAEARLKSVLGEIRQFRDRQGLIDPVKTAAATAALATRLRDELLGAKAELATLLNYMKGNAPTVRVLKARIRSLEAQRRSLAREMTGSVGGEARPPTLSHVLASYEQLESERQFAEAAYQHALQALDQARATADRQHVFVASFIPPSLPEEPLYPRRWRAVGTVALLAFALWGIGSLAVQSVRDHLA